MKSMLDQIRDLHYQANQQRMAKLEEDQKREWEEKFQRGALLWKKHFEDAAIESFLTGFGKVTTTQVLPPEVRQYYDAKLLSTPAPKLHYVFGDVQVPENWAVYALLNTILPDQHWTKSKPLNTCILNDAWTINLRKPRKENGKQIRPGAHRAKSNIRSHSKRAYASL